MVVLQNITLKKLTLMSFLRLGKKSTAFKVLFKSQKSFIVFQISLSIEKIILFYKKIIWLGVKLTLCDNSDNLSSIEHRGTKTFSNIIAKQWPSSMRGHKDTFFHLEEAPTTRLPNVKMLLR